MAVLPRVVVLLGTALLSATCPVLVLPAQAGTSDDSATAVRWLERAAAAPDRVSYRGTQFVTSWGPQGASSAWLDIVHTAQQGTQISVLGAGATNGVKAFVQHHDNAARPAIDGGPLALLTETYKLVDAGTGTAAGRTAAVVEAWRPDQTLAARFWIDRATGLLLQRHVFTVDGRSLVRATVFTDLRIEKHAFLGHLPPMLPGIAGEPVAVSDGPELRAQGWNCSDLLTDSLRLYDVRRDADALRFSYSDGLFNVSVFEQRGELDPAELHGYTAVTLPQGGVVQIRYGMPSSAVWSSNGIVYTLVGDIPYDVMARVIDWFPHEAADETTALDRLSNGLAKMSKWLTPVGAFAARLG
jgi:negative regulator of sigma E activity